jgi:signal transduction histidine kinase/ActR/RegA family two-component response regulator
VLELPGESGRTPRLDRLAEDAASLQATLKAFAKTTTPLPGTLKLRVTGEVRAFRAHGCAVSPASETSPALLLVLFAPREEANVFVALNQKLTALNDEILRRMAVEEALRESQSALRERAAEAERLNRLKDEFLATVSHELRTPLNAILGWASLLQAQQQAPEVRRAVDVIYRNALAQAKLIDDILDVSRIVSGKIRIEARPAELSAIVEAALDAVRPSAAAKSIELELVQASEVCAITGDPDRIQQVIWNLLSNSVKFSPRGARVRVDIVPQANHQLIRVSDTGQGIAPEFLPFVFQAFRQADSSTTRREGGLGLGLALARHIVELHGGTIAAASEGPGKGSTFEVRLPVQAASNQPETAPSLADPARAPAVRGGVEDGRVRLDGARVLVVDDESDTRGLLMEVLEQAGAQTRAAASVSAACAACSTFDPDVVVSDIGMPGEDGYSLIARLRCIPSFRDRPIPCIALTAYTRVEDQQRALAAGFDAHVGKPVSPSTLVAAVRAVLPDD